MREIQMMQDLSEIVQYEENGIPLYIRTAMLSDYTNMSAPCHWHEDVEWAVILDGTMQYDINGKRIILKKGDTLMINGRQMHYGCACGQEDCFFTCIIFHPSLLGINETLKKKYVAPVVENSGLEFLHLKADTEAGKEAFRILNEMRMLKEQRRICYEMDVIGDMWRLWSYLYDAGLLTPEHTAENVSDDLELQKNMVSFIYQHYSEKLALQDIADAGHVSRSKCCRIFKRYLQQSPVDFLNACRLKASCRLLQDTEYNVTEIALLCGFNHVSYYSLIFREKYQCTPREFRLFQKNKTKE